MNKSRKIMKPNKKYQIPVSISALKALRHPAPQRMPGNVPTSYQKALKTFIPTPYPFPRSYPFSSKPHSIAPIPKLQRRNSEALSYKRLDLVQVPDN